MGGTSNSGRHTILTPTLLKEIEQLIIAGNYTCVACASVGISQSSYFLWIQKGKEDEKNNVKDSIYREFSEAIARAEAIAESNAIIRIDKSARSGNVESAKWFLERKFPKRWGRTDKTEHSGELDLKINLSSLSDEELDKLNREVESQMQRELNNATQQESINPTAPMPIDEDKDRSGKEEKKQ